MTASFQYQGARNISRLISDKLDPHAVLAAEIGPTYEDYRRRWDQARFFQTLPPFPIHVDYELMNKCNLRCPMCLMSRDDQRRSLEQLPPALVKDMISQGAALGQAAAGFGGLWEPLLSPDLPDLVAHARRAGLVDVLFNTNGLLLTEETGRRLIEAGLTKLMISLDAAGPEVYNRMRVGSNYQTVVQNIEGFMNLRKKMNSRLPLVRLSFCLTALNEHELEPFLKRWHGVVDFFSIQSYGRYQTENPPDFPGQSPYEKPSGRCPQPFKRLMIRHNGQVLPCCDASGLPLVMGNIHQKSLAAIWSGQALNSLRQNIFGDRLAAVCVECQSKFSQDAF